MEGIKISQYRGGKVETFHFIGEVVEAHGSESFNSVRVDGSCKHIHQQTKMFK